MARFTLVNSNDMTPFTQGWQSHADSFHAFVKAVFVSKAGNESKQVPPIPIVCKKTDLNGFHRGFGAYNVEDPLHYPFGLILAYGALIIVITRIVRFLLKPLKQPRVVSEIIGGTIVGPSVLGQNKKFAAMFLNDNATYAIRNVGLIGFMYLLFIVGVKMDVSLIRKSGKGPRLTAFFAVAIPLIIVIAVGLFIRPSMDRELAKISSIGGVASSMAITGFFVIYPIIEEINLLNSEVGRMALSISIIIDAVGIGFLVTFEAMKDADYSYKAAIWHFVSAVVLMCFTFVTLRSVAKWVVETTPEGQPVKQSYVILILLAVLVMGFLTDMFGNAIASGSLWLGLVIPNGPPLGSALVERSETVILEIFVPFSYAFFGMFVDVFAMTSAPWSSLAPLFVMAMTGYVFKLLSTLVPSLLMRMPWKDALALSLILSLRGQLEFLLVMHWLDKQIILIPSYTMMILLTAAVTAIATPLTSILYDPTRPYMISTRRTIQHSQNSKELRLVVCIQDEDSVAALINLLELSYPTMQSPLSVHSLHLIEITGRAAPLFICHDDDSTISADSALNAFKLYQKTRPELVEVHSFTAVCPKRTMYQDVCKLALVEEAVLIILPFCNGWLDNVAVAGPHSGGRLSVISNVLDHAPCSVGILVNKGVLQNPIFSSSVRGPFQMIVLFLGGADSREGLVYADRMLMNPDASLTVIRFLPRDHGEAEYDERDKKVDDGLVTWFWTRNQTDRRVEFKEVTVMDGEEMVTAVHRVIRSRHFDLWITGRKHKINPMLLEGLSNWNEKPQRPELGLIGDYVCSIDFDNAASVLVIQQQILRQGNQ